MKCRMCDSSNMEELVSYKNYPIFIGCSSKKSIEDELYDFTVSICKDCNIIQQLNIPPLEVLYKEQRAFGIGETWAIHYDKFFNFMKSDLSLSKSITEIGGGNGLLLHKVQEYVPNAQINDIEPYPYYDLPSINIIKSFFDKHFEINMRFDLIYSSHLVEHLVDLKHFFEKSSEYLTKDGALYIATPNIEKSFENLHLNAFTTDHLNYYTPYTLSNLAKNYGFYLTDYHQYKDHGMYLKYTKKDSGFLSNFEHTDLREKYNKYKNKIESFAEIVNFEIQKPFYLFGAHAFSITFIRYLSSKQTRKIKCVLDNEPTKVNRRLSGTELIVKNPEEISGDVQPIVLVYMGAYTSEIINQLKSINSNVLIYNLMNINNELD